MAESQPQGVPADDNGVPVADMLASNFGDILPLLLTVGATANAAVSSATDYPKSPVVAEWYVENIGGGDLRIGDSGVDASKGILVPTGERSPRMRSDPGKTFIFNTTAGALNYPVTLIGGGLH